MRISDWSSDVCSSDLPHSVPNEDPVPDRGAEGPEQDRSQARRAPPLEKDQVQGREPECLDVDRSSFVIADPGKAGQPTYWVGHAFRLSRRCWASRTDRKSTRLNSSH